MKRLNSYVWAVLAACWLVSAPAYAAKANKDIVAHEWEAYVDTLKPLGGRLSSLLADSRDPQLREEMYALMFSEIASGVIGLNYADAKYPDFWPLLTQAFNNIGVPNPDNVYYATPVDDDGVYRITGFRGSVRLVNFQVGTNSVIARGTGGWGPTLANYDLDDGIHLGPDGAFEVILSRTRPKDYSGDWWPLPASATYLMVRQSAYDWLHELDARLAIERLDLPAAKPRRDAAQIAANLKHIPTWVENYMKLTMTGPRRLKERGLVNKVLVEDLSNIAGLKTQLYSNGLFDLEPDEALLIEYDMPGKCRYWNQQLANEMWSTLDYMHRQTSLNGFSARIDSDGKFRMVVSAQDPGVPNWLDTLGYRRGMVQGRWERCDKTPVPSVRKMKVTEIRQNLPADTPVVTSEARDASIRIRRQGAQLRRRW